MRASRPVPSPIAIKTIRPHHQSGCACSVYAIIKERARLFAKPENLLSFGTAKQVNRLEKYAGAYIAPKSDADHKSGRRRGRIPSHCRAALNYNQLLEEHERGAKPIQSGDKILVLYLKPNRYEFESLAFPAETPRLPGWFGAHFVVDIDRTAYKLFDRKLEGIFDALAGEVAQRWQALGVSTHTPLPAAEYQRVNEFREYLAAANLLFTHCRTRKTFYGFPGRWQYLQALYGDKPLNVLVDEFTTQMKSEGLV